MLLPWVACLEQAGWSLAKLDHRRASHAIREASAIAGAVHEIRGGFPMPPSLLRAVGAVAPHLAPLDLESYLRYHFTKVGDQTRDALRAWVQEGRERGLEVSTLAALSDSLSE